VMTFLILIIFLDAFLPYLVVKVLFQKETSIQLLHFDKRFFLKLLPKFYNKDN